MCSKVIPHAFLLLAPALLLLCYNPLAAQQAQIQAQQRAISPTGGPVKLAIRSSKESLAVGDKTYLEVTLLDQENRTVTTPYKLKVAVQCIDSKNNTTKNETIEIKPGESSATTDWHPLKSGLWTIKVHDNASTLLDNSTAVLVTPLFAPPQTKKKINSKPQSYIPQTRAMSFYAKPARSASAFADPAPEADDPNGQAAVAEASDRGTLLLQVSNRDTDGFQADGMDSADVQAFYVGPSAAPNDIAVYLSNSSGTLIPEPLVIKKGQLLAHAAITSTSAGTATVAFVSSYPPYHLDGQTTYQVKFVRPISGLAIAGPQSISLVDAPHLFATFVDGKHNPIQTDVAREITFTTNNGSMQLKPNTQNVAIGGSSAQTLLIPSYVGPVEITAFTPGHPSVTYKLQVSATSIMLMCLIGGVLGAVCAFAKLKGSILWRVITGIIAGALASWGWVYGALPLMDAQLAHNVVNVLFISIIGGYMGTAVLDFFAKKVGFA